MQVAEWLCKLMLRNLAAISIWLISYQRLRTWWELLFSLAINRDGVNEQAQVGALCQSRLSHTISFYELDNQPNWPSLPAFYLLMKLDLIQQRSISPEQEDKTSFIPSMASAQKHAGLASTPGQHAWLFGSLFIKTVQTNDITKGNVIVTHSRAVHAQSPAERS